MALALMNLIAPLLLDENKPRGACYYAVLVFVVAGLVVTVLLLKDTSHLLENSVDKSGDRVSDSLVTTADSSRQWYGVCFSSGLHVVLTSGRRWIKH